MDQTLNSIENEITYERRNLNRNLEELEEQARALTDWRTHYANYPFAAIGIAAGAGLILGAVTAGGGHRHRPVRFVEARQKKSFGSAAASAASAAASAASKASSALAKLDSNGKATRRISETWETILESLLGVASTAAIGLVSQYVPGFKDEYESRQQPAEGE